MEIWHWFLAFLILALAWIAVWLAGKFFDPPTTEERNYMLEDWDDD